VLNAPKSLQLKDVLWFASLSALACFTALMLWQVVIVSAMRNEVIARVFPRGPVMLDFSNIYLASLMFNLGEKHVYDMTVQLAWQNKLVAPLHLSQAFGFQYPPYVYPLLMPVALVPPALSYAIWCFLGLAFGAAATALLMKTLGGWRRPQGALLLFLSVLSFPGIISIALGQFSWWLLGCYCLILWCLIKSHDVFGGVLLAVAAIKPHYAIFVALPALAKRKWKTLFSAVLAVLALLGIEVAAVGWSAISDYFNVLTGAETLSSNSGVNPRLMSSLRALYATLLPADVALKLSVLTMLVGFVLAIAICVVAEKSEVEFGPLHRWAAALTILIALIASPHCHTHDLLFLAVPGILTLRDEDARRGNWYKGWFWLFVSYPIASWLFCIQGVVDLVNRLPNTGIMLGMLVCGALHFRNLVRQSLAELSANSGTA